MFIFSLLVCCIFSLQYDGHTYLHRTAYYGAPQGSYNLTSDLHFLLPDQNPCDPVNLLLDIHYMQNKVVLAPKQRTNSNCGDDDIVQSLVTLQNPLGFGNNRLRGVVIFLENGHSDRDLTNGPLNIQMRFEGIPIVYITYNTYLNIARSWQTISRQITLSNDGDVDSGIHIPSHAPSVSPEETQIEAPKKTIWWWLSATTLQDWLFLLFGFLCVILLLLIFLKFYKLCRRRVNNSVVIRNLRVRRIQRIPTIQYDPSKVINESCVVCLDDFKLNTTVKLLNCRHAYHPRCIDIWLMQSDKCPLCNADAIKNKKRIYDTCCCFCYRNADNFGFHAEDAEDPNVEMNTRVQVQNNGGERFEDSLIQNN